MGNIHGGIYRMSGTGNYPYYDIRFDQKTHEPIPQERTSFEQSRHSSQNQRSGHDQNLNRSKTLFQSLPSEQSGTQRGDSNMESLTRGRSGQYGPNDNRSRYASDPELRHLSDYGGVGRRSGLTFDQTYGPRSGHNIGRNSLPINDPGAHDVNHPVDSQGRPKSYVQALKELDDQERHDAKAEYRRKSRKKSSKHHGPHGILGGSGGQDQDQDPSSEGKRKSTNLDTDRRKSIYFADEQKQNPNSRYKNPRKSLQEEFGCRGVNELPAGYKSLCAECMWKKTDFFSRMDKISLNSGYLGSSGRCTDVNLSPGCLEGVPCTKWTAEWDILDVVTCACGTNRRSYIPTREPLEPCCPHLMEKVRKMIRVWETEEPGSSDETKPYWSLLGDDTSPPPPEKRPSINDTLSHSPPEKRPSISDTLSQSSRSTVGTSLGVRPSTLVTTSYSPGLKYKENRYKPSKIKPQKTKSISRLPRITSSTSSTTYNPNRTTGIQHPEIKRNPQSKYPNGQPSRSSERPLKSKKLMPQSEPKQQQGYEKSKYPPSTIPFTKESPQKSMEKSPKSLEKSSGNIPNDEGNKLMPQSEPKQQGYEKSIYFYPPSTVPHTEEIPKSSTIKPMEKSPKSGGNIPSYKGVPVQRDKEKPQDFSQSKHPKSPKNGANFDYKPEKPSKPREKLPETKDGSGRKSGDLTKNGQTEHPEQKTRKRSEIKDVQEPILNNYPEKSPEKPPEETPSESEDSSMSSSSIPTGTRPHPRTKPSNKSLGSRTQPRPGKSARSKSKVYFPSSTKIKVSGKKSKPYFSSKKSIKSKASSSKKIRPSLKEKFGKSPFKKQEASSSDNDSVTSSPKSSRSSIGRKSPKKFKSKPKVKTSSRKFHTLPQGVENFPSNDSIKEGGPENIDESTNTLEKSDNSIGRSRSEKPMDIVRTKRPRKMTKSPSKASSNISLQFQIPPSISKSDEIEPAKVKDQDLKDDDKFEFKPQITVNSGLNILQVPAPVVYQGPAGKDQEKVASKPEATKVAPKPEVFTPKRTNFPPVVVKSWTSWTRKSKKGSDSDDEFEKKRSTKSIRSSQSSRIRPRKSASKSKPSERKSKSKISKQTSFEEKPESSIPIPTSSHERKKSSPNPSITSSKPFLPHETSNISTARDLSPTRSSEVFGPDQVENMKLIPFKKPPITSLSFKRFSQRISYADLPDDDSNHSLKTPPFISPSEGSIATIGSIGSEKSYTTTTHTHRSRSSIEKSDRPSPRTKPSHKSLGNSTRRPKSIKSTKVKDVSPTSTSTSTGTPAGNKKVFSSKSFRTKASSTDENPTKSVESDGESKPEKSQLGPKSRGKDRKPSKTSITSTRLGPGKQPPDVKILFSQSDKPEGTPELQSLTEMEPVLKAHGKKKEKPPKSSNSTLSSGPESEGISNSSKESVISQISTEPESKLEPSRRTNKDGKDDKPSSKFAENEPRKTSKTLPSTSGKPKPESKLEPSTHDGKDDKPSSKFAENEPRKTSKTLPSTSGKPESKLEPSRETKGENDDEPSSKFDKNEPRKTSKPSSSGKPESKLEPSRRTKDGKDDEPSSKFAENEPRKTSKTLPSTSGKPESKLEPSRETKGEKDDEPSSKFAKNEPRKTSKTSNQSTSGKPRNGTELPNPMNNNQKGDKSKKILSEPSQVLKPSSGSNKDQDKKTPPPKPEKFESYEDIPLEYQIVRPKPKSRFSKTPAAEEQKSEDSADSDSGKENEILKNSSNITVAPPQANAYGPSKFQDLTPEQDTIPIPTEFDYLLSKYAIDKSPKKVDETKKPQKTKGNSPDTSRDSLKEKEITIIMGVKKSINKGIPEQKKIRQIPENQSQNRPEQEIESKIDSPKKSPENSINSSKYDPKIGQISAENQSQNHPSAEEQEIKSKIDSPEKSSEKSPTNDEAPVPVPDDQITKAESKKFESPPEEVKLSPTDSKEIVPVSGVGDEISTSRKDTDTDTDNIQESSIPSQKPVEFSTPPKSNLEKGTQFEEENPARKTYPNSLSNVSTQTTDEKYTQTSAPADGSVKMRPSSSRSATRARSKTPDGSLKLSSSRPPSRLSTPSSKYPRPHTGTQPGSKSLSRRNAPGSAGVGADKIQPRPPPKSKSKFSPSLNEFEKKYPASGGEFHRIPFSKQSKKPTEKTESGHSISSRTGLSSDRLYPTRNVSRPSIDTSRPSTSTSSGPGPKRFERPESRSRSISRSSTIRSSTPSKSKITIPSSRVGKPGESRRKISSISPARESLRPTPSQNKFSPLNSNTRESRDSRLSPIISDQDQNISQSQSQGQIPASSEIFPDQNAPIPGQITPDSSSTKPKPQSQIVKPVTKTENIHPIDEQTTVSSASEIFPDQNRPISGQMTPSTSSTKPKSQSQIVKPVTKTKNIHPIDEQPSTTASPTTSSHRPISIPVYKPITLVSSETSTPTSRANSSTNTNTDLKTPQSQSQQPQPNQACRERRRIMKSSSQFNNVSSSQAAVYPAVLSLSYTNNTATGQSSQCSPVQSQVSANQNQNRPRQVVRNDPNKKSTGTGDKSNDPNKKINTDKCVLTSILSDPDGNVIPFDIETCIRKIQENNKKAELVGQVLEIKLEQIGLSNRSSLLDQNISSTTTTTATTTNNSSQYLLSPENQDQNQPDDNEINNEVDKIIKETLNFLENDEKK